MGGQFNARIEQLEREAENSGGGGGGDASALKVLDFYDGKIPSGGGTKRADVLYNFPFSINGRDYSGYNALIISHEDYIALTEEAVVARLASPDGGFPEYVPSILCKYSLGEEVTFEPATDRPNSGQWVEPTTSFSTDYVYNGRVIDSYYNETVDVIVVDATTITHYEIFG